MRPSSFRSSHVVKAKNTITTLITRNAFGIVIHQASCTTRFTSTIGCRSPASVPRCATMPAARSRAIRARSSTDVPFDETVTVCAVADPARLRVLARDLHVAARPLELQLRRALDGGAGEERSVGDEAEPVEPRTGFAL